jgi:hypothetical protein
MLVRYEKSNVATEKYKILSALSCTKEVWLLNRYRHPTKSATIHCKEISMYVFLEKELRGASPKFPHSCVCERFINSNDRSTYFLQQSRQTVRSWEYCI